MTKLTLGHYTHRIKFLEDENAKLSKSLDCAITICNDSQDRILALHKRIADFEEIESEAKILRIQRNWWCAACFILGAIQIAIRFWG